MTGAILVGCHWQCNSGNVTMEAILGIEYNLRDLVNFPEAASFTLIPMKLLTILWKLIYVGCSTNWQCWIEENSPTHPLLRSLDPDNNFYNEVYQNLSMGDISPYYNIDNYNNIFKIALPL